MRTSHTLGQPPGVAPVFDRRSASRRLALRAKTRAQGVKFPGCSTSRCATGVSDWSCLPPKTSLVGGAGFTGRAPGGPSRWSTKRSTEWQPLEPKLVVEVQFDHVSGGRFRHGTTLLRWRPDKAPEQCTMEQLRQKSSRLLLLLEPPRARPRALRPALAKKSPRVK